MKRVLYAVAALVVAGVAAILVFANQVAAVGAGYMAKVACSEIFLAHRPERAVMEGEFRDISPVFDYLTHRIDRAGKSVRVSLYGLGRAKAVYRDGYGCTLAHGASPAPPPPPAPVRAAAMDMATRGSPAARDDIDYAAIDRAMDAAFNDATAATRAILVVKDGAIIAERYAAGFDETTPFLSWSMAKSVTASMVGAAVLRGLVDVNAPAPVPEWRNDAARAAITWNDLLQMQSGLAFDETYNDPQSDVSKMLFRARDAGAVAANRKLEHAPGTFWSYSSGATNLIQRTLRDTLEANDVDYHAFAREALFNPIGAASFVLEPDPSGVFIGSSFVYATARDWARLGMLYLGDGVSRAGRLLPEGWSDYVATPASASDGFYGAQFWLNRPGKDGRPQYIPGAPEDAYLMAGHEGQYVFIAPDRNLVIVRTGMTRGVEPMPLVAPTLAAIYAAVE
ncbi:MAG: serine hydrolase [Parvularculaceae bacterium]|nr:serine hydrolase [Parvularculaceae bacterium]